MNTSQVTENNLCEDNWAVRQRLLSRRCEPLFYCDWVRALFIHFEVDADQLQRHVPFMLDLREGRAFVSLVAFTMCRMRPRFGGPLTELLFRPIATHRFLNVRTCVVQRGEPGIYFLVEWLSNRCAVELGPRAFGLPYRFGRLDYDHQPEERDMHGMISNAPGTQRLIYEGRVTTAEEFAWSEAGTLDEFLLERYTAFTRRNEIDRYFRIWHRPWPQLPCEIILRDDTLLRSNWTFFNDAKFIGAHFSPGVENIFIGWPHRIQTHRNRRRRLHQAFLEFP